MNSSLRSADRNTHLKIVAVSLLAAIVVLTVGINARIADSNTTTARIQADGPIVKAGKPAIYSTNEAATIR
jgi:hypothetical protein